MRALSWLVVLFGLGLAVAGCSRDPSAGPKVDAFTGHLVHDGKPVKFSSDEKVSLKLFHEKGESFGIPLQPDGSFKIGWMLTGKYAVTLTRERTGSGAKGGQKTYTVPGGLTIETGKTDYALELGKGWKP
ncbi:MAG: hypothetical protein U0736_04170 [Gemmataceae bacterium]